MRVELCRNIELMLGSILGMCPFFLIIICKGRYLPCRPPGRSMGHRRPLVIVGWSKLGRYSYQARMIRILAWTVMRWDHETRATVL